MSGNPGINKLGKVLQQRIRENSKSPLVLDFGVIQGDYSLLTNTYPIPIPKSDYLVCRQLTLGATGTLLTITAKDGAHTHGPSGEHGGHISGTGEHSHTDEAPHTHAALIPEKMRSIKPGDRVLVAWVQNDAIVIDIVLSASAM